jgi:peptidoglycan/xylan/chitin deacetylase (PgdA/CDA1 family)
MSLLAEGQRRRAENAVRRPALPSRRPPGRAAALARFLDYVKSHDDVWVTRRIDIARHWWETHPPKAG